MLDQASSLRKLVENNININCNMGKAKIITITSGKGGVGKSNLVVNLAIGLQQEGKKVLIFDADIGMCNDDILLGIFPKYNIYDLLLKDMNIEDIIVEGPLGIGLLSGGSGINKIEDLSQNQRSLFLSKLMSLDKYDYILMDTGAGISKNVMAFVAACDELIITTTPEPTALTDAYALLKATKHYGLKEKASVVVNKCFTENEGYETFKKFKGASKKFLNVDLTFLGCVLDDKKLEEAVRERTPVLIRYPSAKASRSIYAIGKNILGVPSTNKKGVGDFFKKLFDIFA
ncbi:MinD/ParA family protein [Clostridium massiliamazoniense]|uniref:MinD/ParA family protein n=1 Tax=Clostridium massiliamazoniense TaxID=1347366 RepID=UPI0006D80848|nr:MinD/ParA family protein [Clostridium massiliamazoniense]